MKKPAKQQLWLALCCLVSVGIALRNTNGLDGTEFSGGWLTGPLLSMAELAILLFLLSILVTFFFHRAAAAIALAGSLLCLPLYLYFTAPVPFGNIFGFGHEFKVRQATGLHWHIWPVAGIFLVIGTVYICLAGFRRTNQ